MNKEEFKKILKELVENKEVTIEIEHQFSEWEGSITTAHIFIDGVKVNI